MRPITRRQNLSVLAGAAARFEPGGGIIDAHVHVWTADTAKYPLAPGFRKDHLWFPSFTLEELFDYSRGTAVRRVNLVQMTWYGLDHSYIADIIAREPGRFVGTGIVPAVTDVAGPSPDDTMVALAKQGIVAFRIRGKSTRPAFPDGAQWLDHPGYEKMFAAAAANRLALSFLMSPPDIPEISRMCGRFPDATVIVDHLAMIGRKGVFPQEEVDALCGMAKHRRVLVKVGAFYALGARKPPYRDLWPLVERVVSAFGPDRCMWESDAPLQAKPPHSYEAALSMIQDAGFLKADDKEQILIRTADEIFFRRRV